MKTKRPISFIIILLCALFFGISGAAFLFYAMNFCYDTEIRHFDYGSVSVIAAWALFACTLVLAAVSFFITGKKTVFDNTCTENFSFTNTFFTVLGACFSAFFALMLCKIGMQPGREIYSLLLIVFSFLAALWFIFDGFGLEHRLPSAKFLAICPAAMTLFLTVYIYFNTQYSMNSPMKALVLIMILSLMLNYTELCGVIFEAPASARKYTACAVLSIGIGGAVALALLATSVYSATGFNNTLLFSALAVVLWLISIFKFAKYSTNALVPDTSRVSDDTDGTDDAEDSEDGTEDSEDGEDDSEDDEDDADDTEDDVDDSEDDGDDADDSDGKDKAAQSNESQDPAKSTYFALTDVKKKKKPCGKDEFYFENEGSDGEDIYLPPVEFDDEDEETDAE